MCLRLDFSSISCRLGHFDVAAQIKELILTLLFTFLAEGVVVIVYSVWRKKPASFLLFTNVLANVITQVLLWTALRFFFRRYFATLLIAEILIWMIEGVFLYGFRLNRLNLREALWLSLSMNLASFALGWALPL